MKFHLTLDNQNAVCGCVTNRPDTFLYNEKGFTSHLATEYRCKKCDKILKGMNSIIHKIDSDLHTFNEAVLKHFITEE